MRVCKTLAHAPFLRECSIRKGTYLYHGDKFENLLGLQFLSVRVSSHILFFSHRLSHTTHPFSLSPTSLSLLLLLLPSLSLLLLLLSLSFLSMKNLSQYTHWKCHTHFFIACGYFITCVHCIFIVNGKGSCSKSQLLLETQPSLWQNISSMKPSRLYYSRSHHHVSNPYWQALEISHCWK